MKSCIASVLIFVSAVLCISGSTQGPCLLAGEKKGPTPDSKKENVDEKSIRALIAELGDDVFDKREKAHQRLLRIGGPAIELLRKASKESTDLEMRERAGQLAEAIQELGLHSFRVDSYHSFRNQAVLDNKFELFGTISPQAVKSEPEGLRISLPSEKKIGPTGISADFLLKGDFEITVGYELAKPAQPGRSGFELYIMSDTTTMEAIAFERILRADGKDAYICNRMTTIDGGRRNTYGGGEVPAKGKSGHMRIMRVGSKVALSVKEESDVNFRVVHRVELGEEALKLVRIAALPYGTGTAIDLRLLDVRVRGVEADAIRPLTEAKTIKNRKKPRD
jgi:hypothetical protein